MILYSMLTACGGNESNNAPVTPPVVTRSFQMGFTPWLYEASFTAQDMVYDQIQNNGDIISQHLMAGIPWEEALNGTTCPQAVEGVLSVFVTRTRVHVLRWMYG